MKHKLKQFQAHITFVSNVREWGDENKRKIICAKFSAAYFVGLFNLKFTRTVICTVGMHNVQCAYKNDVNILWSLVRCKCYLYYMLSVAVNTRMYFYMLLFAVMCVVLLIDIVLHSWRAFLKSSRTFLQFFFIFCFFLNILLVFEKKCVHFIERQRKFQRRKNLIWIKNM